MICNLITKYRPLEMHLTMFMKNEKEMVGIDSIKQQRNPVDFLINHYKKEECLFIDGDFPPKPESIHGKDDSKSNFYFKFIYKIGLKYTNCIRIQDAFDDPQLYINGISVDGLLLDII